MPLPAQAKAGRAGLAPSPGTLLRAHSAPQGTSPSPCTLRAFHSPVQCARHLFFMCHMSFFQEMADPRGGGEPRTQGVLWGPLWTWGHDGRGCAGLPPLEALVWAVGGWALGRAGSND